MGNDKINLAYWVWLQSVLGYQCPNFTGIIQRFKTAENVYKCDRTLLKETKLFTKKQLESIDKVSLDDANKVVCDCIDNGIKIITFTDKEYPNKLKNIYAPPTVLYVLGEMPSFDSTPTICVVGPRKPSENGIKAAFSLSFRIASGNMLVVSGGALGIDTCAHKGALCANEKTVAVLGCGILDDYLSQNAPLRESIRNNGCLISEFQPRYEASKFSFPVRNRIMSGLSDGVVVIEAGEKSGALITANCATEQDRDVFVIVGSPWDPNYYGTNKLFKDGAIPVFKAEDIFAEYELKYPNVIDLSKAYAQENTKLLKEEYKKFAEQLPFKKQTKTRQKADDLPKEQPVTAPNLSEFSDKETLVLTALPEKPFVIEQINLKDVSISDLYLIITKFELAGIVESLPGGMYKKLI